VSPKRKKEIEGVSVAFLEPIDDDICFIEGFVVEHVAKDTPQILEGIDRCK